MIRGESHVVVKLVCNEDLLNKVCILGIKDVRFKIKATEIVSQLYIASVK